MNLAQGKKMLVLTQQELKKNVFYNPESGIFTRLISIANSVKVGEVAGGLRGDGYVSMQINGKRYAAHRLAWFT